MGKPVERRGRKVTGLQGGELHDSGIADAANHFLIHPHTFPFQ
jgi:hypothetical protein